jgi:cobalt-zinc-cadmium efflux system protein
MSHYDTHPHHHGARQVDAGVRALWWSLALHGGYMLVEAGVGWWSGSLALLSDAAHMASDVGGLVVALGAAQLARRAPDASHTFGLRRAETLGALLNGLLLVGAAAWIVYEAVHRLAAGIPEIPGVPVLLVAAIGLGVNVGSAVLLWRSGADDLNVRGAIVHMAADGLGSVGALVAAGFVIAGFSVADPIVSVLISALVLYGAWTILRDAVRVLMQLPPAGFDVPEVVAALAALPGVVNVHDLHCWTLDGASCIVTAHVVVDDDHEPDEVRRAALALLESKHQVEHATLQVERQGATSPSAGGVS